MKQVKKLKMRSMKVRKRLNEVFETKVETINDIIQNNEQTKDEVIQKEKTEAEAKETTKDESNKETDEGKHRANVRSATLTT